MLILVVLVSGCYTLNVKESTVKLEEDSFDCYWNKPMNHFYEGSNMFLVDLLAENLTKYQSMLDYSKLSVITARIKEDAGGLSIVSFAFMDPSFEHLVNIACNESCSKVTCEYFKILFSGSKPDCMSLPKKTFITNCYLLGIMEGHRMVCENMSVNYRDTCYFQKSLEEKYVEDVNSA